MKGRLENILFVWLFSASAAGEAIHLVVFSPEKLSLAAPLNHPAAWYISEGKKWNLIKKMLFLLSAVNMLIEGLFLLL